MIQWLISLSQRKRTERPAIVQNILKSLDKMDDWRFDEFHAKHSAGIVLWIANGACSLEVCHPFEFTFSYQDKLAIWNKLKTVKSQKLSAMIKGKSQSAIQEHGSDCPCQLCLAK